MIRCAIFVSLFATGCRSLPTADAPTPDALKALSLEELLDIEVTTVSKRGEKLATAPAAGQILTAEDIRRSGATTLAEALRLATNLQVAQVNAHDWAITARGFNGASLGSNSFADKLLVLIDGRSVYSPLFAGVFWDVQHVLLEDVDRIEVVSGPGGTLWGANAVNGVVNVVTRDAKETQGGHVSVAAGSFLRRAGAARYGGTIGDAIAYRFYGQRIDHDGVELANGFVAHDDWTVQQAGMRADYKQSATDTLTLQTDYYDGREGTPDGAFVNGANVVARWTRVTSPRNEWQVQFYWDHNGRTIPAPRQNAQVSAFDLDVQHRFPLGIRHDVLWGFGYRYTHDALTSDGLLSFVPATRNLKLASAFVQDEITPISDKLRVIIGAKVEHDDLLGIEVQPSVRMAWTPQARQMGWTAVSRAVRSPSRFDRDLVSPGTVGGGEDFASENVIAWEAGYRAELLDRVSLSLAAFHNRYDHLRSFNRVAPRPAPLVLANDRAATSNGVELSARFQAAQWWRLRGGATWMTTTFRDTSALVVPGSAAFEARDPRSQLLVQSMMDLPAHLQLDLVGRYVHDIPASVLGPSVTHYATFDARIAWRRSQWELSVVGQNLGAGEHAEFDSPALQHEIPRGVYGKLAFTW